MSDRKDTQGMKLKPFANRIIFSENNINPFFQVIIYQADCCKFVEFKKVKKEWISIWRVLSEKEVSDFEDEEIENFLETKIDEFLKYFKEYLRNKEIRFSDPEDSKPGTKLRHLIFIKKEIKPQPGKNETRVYQIVHRFYPSWIVRVPGYQVHDVETEFGDTLKDDKDELLINLENLENHLLICHRHGRSFFIHSTLSIITNLVKECINSFNELQQDISGKGIHPKYSLSLNKVSVEKIYNLLNQHIINFRTLGIHNLFNPGGAAPEAKAYFGKDTKYSLSYAFDSGYSLGYSFGSTRIKNDDHEPFGVSVEKRKIWTTWAKTIKDFEDHCNNLGQLMKKAITTRNLEMLVSPTKIVKKDLISFKLICFYMDYNHPKKGILLLETNGVDPTPDWECALVGNNTLEFKVNNSTGSQTTRIQFKSDENLNWKFSYQAGAQTINVLFSFSGSTTIRGSRNGADLVKYLNNQENYTFVFSKGFAYRNGTYWKDNRAGNPFNKVKVFDWKKHEVDIRAESSIPRSPFKRNILQAMEEIELVEEPDIIYIINDDGANEVADLVAISETKWIYVHAKFSSQKEPGLRAKDIQVVSAQTIKNLRFFIPTQISDKILERFWDRKYKSKSRPSLKEFKTTFRKKVSDYRIKKECWIVQPGISQGALNRNKKNKIHCILNHVDGICNAGNIEFKLICSP